MHFPVFLTYLKGGSYTTQPTAGHLSAQSSLKSSEVLVFILRTGLTQKQPLGDIKHKLKSLSTGFTEGNKLKRCFESDGCGENVHQPDMNCIPVISSHNNHRKQKPSTLS